MPTREPFQQVNWALQDAADLLDRADDLVGDAYAPGVHGEEAPTPPALDEAQRLWQEAYALIGRAATLLKPLVAEERAREDEDDRDPPGT